MVPITPAEFKRVLGRFATGITVVTVQTEEGGHGMTATAFTSVSLNPPLILVCVDQTAATHGALLNSERFLVNILGLTPDHRATCMNFAGKEKDWSLAHWTYTLWGPKLDNAVAVLGCTKSKSWPEGDHTIFIGRVDAVDITAAKPLIYFEHQFWRLTALTPPSCRT